MDEFHCCPYNVKTTIKIILTIVATDLERHAPLSQASTPLVSCVLAWLGGACLSETVASIVKIILS